MMPDYASDDDPTTEEEALRSPQRQERNDAMREEYNLSCEMEHESLKIDQKAKRQDQQKVLLDGGFFVLNLIKIARSCATRQATDSQC